MVKHPVLVARGCGVLVASLLFVLGPTTDVAAAKTTSPTTWGTQFCNAVRAWGDQIDASNAQVTTSAAKATGLADAKALLAKGFQRDAVLTARAADAIHRAGVPSVRNGAKLSALFVNAFRRAQQLMLDAATSANELPTDDPATFLSGSAALVAKLEVDPITPAFKSAKAIDATDKLGDALAANPRCKFLST